MLQAFFALGAGIATVTSPCILPMLPLLLGATATPSPAAPSARQPSAFALRPLFIVMGFVIAFASAALLFSASTRVLGVSQDSLRTGSVVVLVLFGGLLVWPGLLDRAMAPFGGLADMAQRLGDKAGAGHGGAVLLGMSLGLLWTPCAGPVLASILALIANEQEPARASGLLVVYSLGAGLPMLAIAYGGHAVATRVRMLVRHALTIRRTFGVLVIATAAAMHWQLDTAAAAWLSRSVPASASGIDAPGPAGPAITASAPEFDGLDHWFNSTPLTMAQLRGRVVLVDFWTFACVNCINTLRHLQHWHERYAAKGLVVVGVHTPEFAFERETANVQRAIERHGIGYAVAQDNHYRTWNAWGNQYWPGLYLVDRSGRIVFRHSGEGDYEQIERQIEQALRDAQ